MNQRRAPGQGSVQDWERGCGARAPRPPGGGSGRAGASLMVPPCRRGGPAPHWPSIPCNALVNGRHTTSSGSGRTGGRTEPLQAQATVNGGSV